MTFSQCISRERFELYIDAFNRNDRETYSAFYAPDVVLVIAGRTELRGPQAILDFYKQVKAQTHRTIAVKKTIISERQLAAELESEFLALEDVPDFTAGPMRTGDRIYINTFAFYDLVDGRFRRIRSAVFRKEYRPAA